MAETAINSSYPLPRERNLILGSLLVLAAAAWGLLIWQAAVMDEEMSLTMGLSAPLWIALWIAMMVAIMFPTAAPMVMLFARVHAKKAERGQPFVPTWIFASSYLIVWSAVGLLAYTAAVAGDAVADESMWVVGNAPRIGGGLLIAAGAYQLSPLKYVCLNKCRSPMSFILTSWRDGYGGSFRMGLEHGVYCLGCCWLLFAILFPLGMMNIAVLALITLLIFAEKSTPIGRQVAALAAVGLIVYGAVVIFVPDALPMTMDSSQAMEMGGMDSDLGTGEAEMGSETEMGGSDGGMGTDETEMMP
jgi:predicted metal-binding membrane protein